MVASVQNSHSYLYLTFQGTTVFALYLYSVLVRRCVEKSVVVCAICTVCPHRRGSTYLIYNNGAEKALLLSCCGGNGGGSGGMRDYLQVLYCRYVLYSTLYCTL